MTGTQCLFSSFVKRFSHSAKYKPGHRPQFGLLELIIYISQLDHNTYPYKLYLSGSGRASDFGLDASTFNLVHFVKYIYVCVKLKSHARACINIFLVIVDYTILSKLNHL